MTPLLLGRKSQIFWFFPILSRNGVSGPRLHWVCVGGVGRALVQFLRFSAIFAGGNAPAVWLQESSQQDIQQQVRERAQQRHRQREIHEFFERRRQEDAAREQREQQQSSRPQEPPPSPGHRGGPRRMPSFGAGGKTPLPRPAAKPGKTGPSNETRWLEFQSKVCGRGALERKGPQSRPQKRDRRLEEVAKAVGGGYCRSQRHHWHLPHRKVARNFPNYDTLRLGPGPLLYSSNGSKAD